MRLRLRSPLAGVLVVLACGADTRDEAETEPQVTSAGSASSTSTTTGSDKLDVGDSAGSETVGNAGCEKVDFLFVVDNSQSMEDEQQNLVASFGGFIDTISATLLAQDYNIMVIDTDAESLSFGTINCSNNDCTCEPLPQCCFAVCANELAIPLDPPPDECDGMACSSFELPTGCPVTLGAGKAEDSLGNPCGFAGDLRFMTGTQPDLAATFECAALVGAGGDGNERPMDAMIEALGAQTAPGGCHDGFLRDDAILVVTFITDEDDDGSDGTPQAWADAVLAAKGERQDAVVMLGLLGDSGVDGGRCTEAQAQDASLLRQFAESFDRGSWGSVCEPSYNAFFDAAVSLIDTTCDEFVPQG